MGNQNKPQRTCQNKDPRHIINLDAIVEQWIWNKVKTKSLSKYKREDLLITINWKHVLFTQSDIHFYNSSSIHFPRSQILFRTNFDNKTNNEQLYTFATERFSHSIFKFMFTKSFCKSQESIMIFRLPEQLNSGEQYVQFGQDTSIKEFDVPWNVNSQIHVPFRTRIIAELNIDEEEFHSQFSVSVRFSGHITATIATRQLPNSYLKCIDGDIVEIVQKAMKNNQQLKDFEVHKGSSPLVCFTMYGRCLFRYGIEQHIVINQELLDSYLNCMPSAPLDDLIHSNINNQGMK